MESDVSVKLVETVDEMERLPRGGYTLEFREQAVRTLPVACQKRDG